MRALVMVALLVGATACTPATTSTAPIAGAIPGVSTACEQITVERLDLAWRTYDAVIDAINLLLDKHVLLAGTAQAKAVADANDRVLAGLKAAEAARKVCNSTSYSAALVETKLALDALRSAFWRRD